jgi:hypothetical protein
MWYNDKEYLHWKRRKERERRESKLPPDGQALAFSLLAYSCIVILFPPLWFFLYMREKRRNEDG